MNRLGNALVIEENEAVAAQLEGWLRDAGYVVRYCAGPTAPRYRCAEGHGGPRALIRDADLVLIDPWIASDDVMDGVAAIDLLTECAIDEIPTVVFRHGWDLRNIADAFVSAGWPPTRSEILTSIDTSRQTEQGRTGPMSTATNAHAMQRIVAHHRAMTEELTRRVEGLARAVTDGAEVGAHLGMVKEYLTSELLPHARAEELTMYPAAGRRDLQRFVDGMIDEHRDLAARVERLTRTTDANEALDIARGIASTFAEHARKENDVLLPALADDPSCDLAALLEDMHEIFGREEEQR